MLKTFLLKPHMPHESHARLVKSSVDNPLQHKPSNGFASALNADLTAIAMNTVPPVIRRRSSISRAQFSTKPSHRRSVLNSISPRSGGDLLTEQHCDITGYNFTKPC